MRAPSDVADWVQQETSKQKDWFEEFALDHPNYWIVIGLYGAEINTAIDVNTGIVDVLRFGNGIAEGTPKGYVLDFLRFLSVADGVSEALGPVLGRMARLWVARHPNAASCSTKEAPPVPSGPLPMRSNAPGTGSS